MKYGAKILLVSDFHFGAEDQCDDCDPVPSLAIITALHPHRENVHTLTYDNGKEFARHRLIVEILGSTACFAQPYHS